MFTCIVYIYIYRCTYYSKSTIIIVVVISHSWRLPGLHADLAGRTAQHHGLSTLVFDLHQAPGRKGDRRTGVPIAC